ncbi:MAG: ribosome silencing factor [Planctomycetota bacterium]
MLDVVEQTTVTSCIVIGTGTSDRQMKSALDNLKDVAEAFDARPARVSEDEGTTWLLADFVDVVVHLFEPNARAYYDLESMWVDALRIEPASPDHRPTGGPSE